ncbi:DUF3604 domain-containing protein [Egibacter rhizosphaerae]|uniref:DUF3604 domain-containing protein n=1 Tax=Egibacter rhizosphaerae TaxID=1670831 RepID=A0A411YKD6_9ACTN|nr:DUF3604 domain-containing protein [Egibacter rhizosphaerae]QBI21679.1 DUF3604 domain-containing protein [Egibacter rhizosphaerae]
MAHAHPPADGTPELEEDVLAFNRELVAAMRGGRDVTEVIATLDPDPLRYIWVDEGGGELPAMLAAGRDALARAPAIPGHERGDGTPVHQAEEAARPTVAVRPGDNAVLTAWLVWEPGRGERVWARVAGPDGVPLVPAAALHQTPVDCVRPTAIFDAEGTPWVCYAAASGPEPPAGEVGVWAQAHREGHWEAPVRISHEGPAAHPAFNQEAAVAADGALEVCWQGRAGEGFAIFRRRYEDGQWGAITRVSPEGTGNAWDPSIAPLPDGRLAVVWSAYSEGYRILQRVVDRDGQGDPPRALTEGADYGVHPSLAVTSTGELWCAFDLVTVHGHGGSGPTQLKPAGATEAPGDHLHRDTGRYIPAELRPNVSARIAVVRIDDDGVREAAGELAPGLEVNPAGLPVLVADARGGLWLTYRIMRRLPLLHYHWEVAAQPLGPDGWGPVTTFAGSDAGLEEPALAADPRGGAALAWQADDRCARSLEWTEGFGGREQAERRAHHGEVVWDAVAAPGRIREGRVRPVEGSPAASPAPVAAVHADTRTEVRPFVDAERERVTVETEGETLTLWWGDLHRHSLISRCTAGDEPALDDFYRYAWDVSEYDFWAVTDHAENTNAYQWWGIQKLADLFRVDGRFVPLYGFEWTSWLGHQNVIYGDVPRGAPIFSAEAESTDDPAKLWAALREHPDHPAITIPHHPGAVMVPYDWSYYDPDYLRAVEIFQACRGNYEDDGAFRQYSDGTLTGTFTLDGLRRGHRFGLLASSDHGNGASYVGVYAPRLDRASVFEGLHARRTIAATTRGIALDFRVDGAFLGEEIVRDGPVTLYASVRGYRDVARLEVLREGEVVAARIPALDLPQGWLAVPVRVEWGLAEEPTDWSGSLRIDGGAVLQTPYWSPELTEVADDAAHWRASTHALGGGGLYESQRGGVELTLLGPPTAEVVVETAGGLLKTTLGEAAAGPVEGTPQGSGRIGLQAGTGGLTSLGSADATLDATDDPAGGSTWYYARAFLVDGEMAWSSPVWVDPSAG